MSPGPLTSRQHGGHGFGPRYHGFGYGRIAPPTVRNRDYGARSIPDMRQRFSVGSDGSITLDPGDKLTVAIGEDGVATVIVATPEDEAEPASEPSSPAAPTPIPLPPAPEQLPGPPPANGAGRGFTRSPRGYYGRTLTKMAMSSNSDGSITVRPEGEATLQVVGDPLSGAVTIVEIIPEPLAVAP
jgi:hypothetical protein